MLFALACDGVAEVVEVEAGIDDDNCLLRQHEAAHIGVKVGARIFPETLGNLALSVELAVQAGH